MTTVAYRDGTMAADTRAYRGDRGPLGTKIKIENVNGMLFGVSSANLGVPDAVRKWIREGMDLKQLPEPWEDWNFEALVVMPDGTARRFDGKWHPTKAKAEFYTIGTGEDFAMAAMFMGASAEDAVRVACRLDIWSEEPITVLRHGDVDERQDLKL
jgi:hypothetical protein